MEALPIRIDFEKYKFMQFFIAKSKLITDKGLIWQDEKEEEIYTLDGLYNDIAELGPKNNYTFIDMKFHPSNKDYFSRRVYNKLQSILADTLAICEYIRIIIRVFCVMFTNTKKNIKLMNTLFEFDFDRKNFDVANKKTIDFLKHRRTVNTMNREENFDDTSRINKTKTDLRYLNKLLI